MLKKKPVKKSDKTSVVFELTGVEADNIAVAGEFNGWALEANQMKLRKDGSWAATIRLPKNEKFEFRYVVDGKTWMIDEDADALVPNPFGGSNSVVDLC